MKEVITAASDKHHTKIWKNERVTRTKEDARLTMIHLMGLLLEEKEDNSIPSQSSRYLSCNQSNQEHEFCMSGSFMLFQVREILCSLLYLGCTGIALRVHPDCNFGHDSGLTPCFLCHH